MINKIKKINPVIAPLLSLALIVCSSAPFLTFISLKIIYDGHTETIVGIIQSAYFAGFLLGSLRAERLIRRTGYIRSFAAFSSLYGLTVLIQGLFINAILWIFMRLLAGISIAAIYIVIESWLLSGSKINQRGKILSIYMIILYASQSFSQLLLQFTSPNTLIAFLIFGILSFLAIIPVSINYSKTPETSTVFEKIKFKQIYSAAPFSFWGSLISGLILSAIYSFFPIFAKARNLHPSYMMFITIAGGFILQWPLGHLSDIFERRKILILASICIAIPSLIILFLNNHAIYIYMLCFFIGGFSFVIYPISVTQVTDRFNPEYIPYVIGLISLVYGIGAMLGPTLTSLFMEFSMYGLFVYILILSSLLTLVGIYYKIKYPMVIPKEQKKEFIPTNASIHINIDLDPRVINPIKNQNDSSHLK
ncbi:MAG: MFS transporter [Parachlamydiales bacterium]|nr:MFS transporter [Parachlamydiales bacterium]